MKCIFREIVTNLLWAWQLIGNKLFSKGVDMSGAWGPASAAKISHNNVSEECVYVSTVDSQWKLGGFETARHFKKIDTSVSIILWG